MYNGCRLFILRFYDAPIRTRILKFLILFLTIAFSVHRFHLVERNQHQLLSHMNHRKWSKLIRHSEQVRCTILLREQSGRLGNRLFMFASALGVALTHSCHLHISPQIIHELNQSFALDLERLPFGAGPSHTRHGRKLFNHCSFLTDLFPSNSSQTIELTGFWQVHTYFANHSIEIRQQLRFKPLVLQQVNAFLSNVNGIRVGIHIRRGDFLQVRTVSSDQYIRAAMSYFTQKYPSVIFVIVTDDRRYCERVYGKRKDVLFTPPSFDSVADLATLTRCDHMIITVGTFGWWGAYLLHDRAGEVVTDAKPDRSPIDANCEGKLYFPPWFLFLNKTV
jgi:galactoside 2-L-fucosyltransferase 1/2